MGLPNALEKARLATSKTGWSVGATYGRPPWSCTVRTRTPGGASFSTWRETFAKMSSGS